MNSIDYNEDGTVIVYCESCIFLICPCDLLKIKDSVIVNINGKSSCGVKIPWTTYIILKNNKMNFYKNVSIK